MESTAALKLSPPANEITFAIFSTWLIIRIKKVDEMGFQENVQTSPPQMSRPGQAALGYCPPNWRDCPLNRWRKNADPHNRWIQLNGSEIIGEK
jgi:hypothetical protein